MPKNKTVFICENCGHNESKWVGRCNVCGEWNTFIEETTAELAAKTSASLEEIDVRKLSEIQESDIVRIKTGFEEFDRVLGGGLVNDGIILISGEPGIGKSTLLLQTASFISGNKSVLYASGEESANQVFMRAKRLFDSAENYDKISFISSGNIDVIIQAAHKQDPDLIIIDSIQTLQDHNLSTAPGGISQIKSNVAKLVQLGKEKGIAILIIGHINKEGKIAGPKALEHLVDAVLQFEGEEQYSYRVLRSLKNRFGSTGEVGIFSMTGKGLEGIGSTYSFIGEQFDGSESGVGKAIVIEGSRPFIVDIQTLVSKTVFQFPKRVSDGISLSKIQVITAILENNKIGKFSDVDVYVRTAQNFSLKNYVYSDLAVAVSLLSSRKNLKINQNSFFLGELSLNGKISAPSYLQRYVDEIKRIYPDSVIYSSSDLKNIKPISKVTDIEKILLR